MNINITKEEYNAICEAEDQLATSIESADEEYIKATNPICAALVRVMSKYKKAREMKQRRKFLYNQCKQMYPQIAPVTIRKIVSIIIEDEKK